MGSFGRCLRQIKVVLRSKPVVPCVLITLVIVLIWNYLDLEVLKWGCYPKTSQYCVVALRSSVTTQLVVNQAAPRHAAWCSSAALQLPPRRRCRDLQHGLLRAVDASVEAIRERRMCADWFYSCSGKPMTQTNLTMWYHHFHKAGGSSFVRLAEANGARFMPRNQNGNPLTRDSYERIQFWAMSPERQVAWAQDIRRRYRTDTIVSEFGFPTGHGLVTPLPFFYVTILREPLSRIVSNFFWRFRRYFAGVPEMPNRLPPGATPKFGDFAMKNLNLYVSTLVGKEGALQDIDLQEAMQRLEIFSLVLICEWLSSSAKVLEKRLGWKITDFNAFHEKENSAQKDYRLLQAWDPDWKEALARLNAYDLQLYASGQRIAARQLQEVGLKPPETYNRDQAARTALAIEMPLAAAPGEDWDLATLDQGRRSRRMRELNSQQGREQQVP